MCEWVESTNTLQRILFLFSKQKWIPNYALHAVPFLNLHSSAFLFYTRHAHIRIRVVRIGSNVGEPKRSHTIF